MNERGEVTNLEQMLDQLKQAADAGDPVSVGAVLKVVGRRSFGPVLLVGGLITLAPVVGDIPGVPTIIAILLLLIGVQLLFCRDHIWLPDWLLKRSVAREKFRKVIRWLRRPSRFADRFLRPRLAQLTKGAGAYLIAVVCVMIAAAMPLMEVVPFSANGAGAALTAFGLSLVAHDGLLAVVALLFSAATLGLVAYSFF